MRIQAVLEHIIQCFFCESEIVESVQKVKGNLVMTTVASVGWLSRQPNDV